MALNNSFMDQYLICKLFFYILFNDFKKYFLTWVGYYGAFNLLFSFPFFLFCVLNAITLHKFSNRVWGVGAELKSSNTRLSMVSSKEASLLILKGLYILFIFGINK